MEYYDTKTFSLNFKKYCAYCGKEAKSKTEWDEYTPYYYHFCDCESANAEHELNKKISELKKQYKSKIIINEKAVNQVKFDYEMNELKRKYKLI